MFELIEERDVQVVEVNGVNDLSTVRDIMK